MKYLEPILLFYAIAAVTVAAYLSWAKNQASGPQVHRITATWVSATLRGKPMANGWPYTPTNLTVRVPKGLWPLGSWLLVEAGDRKVCVMVTDWCTPWDDGLHIDLSEAAFANLADTRQGRINGITVKRL